MARIARVVAPKYPHHITQRGNRRQQTFFCDDDYEAYINLMAEWCNKRNVECWAYCLMPNHVHLILVPADKDGLTVAVGEAHRRYTRIINFREGWRGHLWQGRFSSFIMDEKHLISCTKYIELNPVRAGLVKSPWDWQWSSAVSHRNGTDDILVKTGPMLKIIQSPWDSFLKSDIQTDEIDDLRKHERTGRPIGEPSFIESLETLLDLSLKRQRPGPKVKD
jgi:putative transposase